MRFTYTDLKKYFNYIITNHWLPLVGVGMSLIWCLPLLATGNKLEWGDFSFFAQGYEAFKISIFDYGQFPWFNPWVSGGVPLYANPQFGLFSIQTPLTWIFGIAEGLKIALSIYTVAGFLSMYLLLRRYFLVPKFASTGLSLAWIFCGFFIAHLPSHFTFAWYMLAPLFIYLCLTLNSTRKALALGGLFAIMALSQIHNPFVHISVLCMGIVAVRLIISKERRALIKPLLIAGFVFIAIAGHRLFYTLQNIKQFPRELVDYAPDLATAISAPFLPASLIRQPSFIKDPQHPLIPHNFTEAAAYLGMGIYIAIVVGLVYLLYLAYTKRPSLRSLASMLRRNLIFKTVLAVIVLTLLFYTLGLGDFAKLSPYNIIKHLPVLSSMRISTRWFIFFNFGLLILTGLAAVYFKKRDAFLYFFTNAMILLAVVELFHLNIGYQTAILTHTPVLSSVSTKSNTFANTAYFGQERTLPNGNTIPYDGSMPDEYREYEATSYNLGVLYANDSFVQLHLDKHYVHGHPTCPFEEGCGFVKSKNAIVKSWSPQKIVLTRTDDKPIFLNMNNSSYFRINGKLNEGIRVSEPFTDFVIYDQAPEITIEANPSLIASIVHSITK